MRFPLVFGASIMVAALSVAIVDSMAPPHPQLVEESRKYRELHEALFPNISYYSLPSLPSGIWESAHDYKLRQLYQQRKLQFLNHDQLEFDTIDLHTEKLGMNALNVNTRFSRNELCRFYEDSDCEEIERGFMEIGLKTRHNLVRFNGDDSSASVTTFDSVDVNNNENEKYTLRTLVILVAWKGQEERMEWITRDRIDHVWNGEGADDDIPTGSIKNYTEQQSYGKLNFVADVIDWRVTDNTEKYYAAGQAGRQRPSAEIQVQHAFHYILDQLEAEDFPWGDYDSDNDGSIDHIQFLHTGYGAESGGVDCYTDSPMEDRIWSHAKPDTKGSWKSAKTGKATYSYSTSTVFLGVCDRQIAQLGVTMHEFYHTLGLPDLYDRDAPHAGQPGRPGLGGLGAFCMMASPFGANNDERYPGSLSPWAKLDIGFLNDYIEITESGTYTARPSKDFPDIFSIKRGFPEGEMLVLENRENSSFDSTLWANGMLIYKMDETQSHFGNRRVGYPGQVDTPEEGDAWPSNGLHYPIALLQADGEYDLENGYNNGDIGDFYRNPDQTLGPGNGELVATEEGTYPNTDSYAFGEIKITGIVIDKFQEVEDGSGSFTFRVRFSEDDNETEISLVPVETVSELPTEVPSLPPTGLPTQVPSKLPTNPPTSQPSSPPSEVPSEVPTFSEAPSSPVTVATSEDPTEQNFTDPTLETEPRTVTTVVKPVPSSECSNILDVGIITDSNPEETSWEIANAETGEILVGHPNPETNKVLNAYTEYHWKLCAFSWSNETSFVFRINDEGGDGLQPPGEFWLTIDDGLIASGGDNVGSSMTFEFSTEEDVFET